VDDELFCEELLLEDVTAEEVLCETEEVVVVSEVLILLLV
jgi:hypothetical protein